MARKEDYNGWDERLYKAVNTDVYMPEVFKVLRSRILYPTKEITPPKSLMITSVVPGEGKSFITANLGISLAHGMDQYSLLVDCDMRRPTLAALFGQDASPGLSDYLSGKKELPELIQKSPIDKLSILASGKPPSNPAELLSSERMKRLVEELSGRYEDRIIIFDTPPALVASESAVLARQVDAVIIVVREGASVREGIRRIINVIEPERILGIVYNGQTNSLLEKTILHTAAGYYTAAKS